MFGDLLRRLTAPEPEPLPFDDARLALAALLVRIARSDGEYEAVEIARIDAVLGNRYELSPFEVAKLRGEAERLEAEALPYDDRVKVIESLWDIVLADGERDHEEDAILRLVAPMLGVNDRDSNLARKRVEAARG